MSLTHHENGISLTELLLAIAIAVVVAATISISLPTAIRNIQLNRQRWVAISLANAQIQSIKSQPYGLVDTTDVVLGATVFGAANPLCDCRTLDFSVLPSTITLVTTTHFALATCIHFVTAGTWTPQCAAAGDTGYKDVLVRVSWFVGSSSSSVMQASMLTRS